MKQKRGFFAGLFRCIGKLLLIAVVLLAGLIGYLSVTEYKPADRETLTVKGTAARTLTAGDSLTVLSWNIGYGALGDNADFFMDGGKMVRTADMSRVLANVSMIESWIGGQDGDILLLQEVDRNSDRSYSVDAYDGIRTLLTDSCSAFANNFKVSFVPYPIPPIGKVDSGIATFSAYPIEDAERVQLPIPFAWPIRMANLKRCLLVSRIPVAGTDRELVAVNLHLEAYDDGEGKVAQTKQLAALLAEEAEMGNYVIAGGDFNQIFSSEDASLYPAQPGKWAAGEIDVAQFDGEWQFLMDETTPSCRSLDQPYKDADKAGFQYYLIDGFIVSGNLRVDALETRDLDFVSSDHNPVLLQVTLQ